MLVWGDYIFRKNFESFEKFPFSQVFSICLHISNRFFNFSQKFAHNCGQTRIVNLFGVHGSYIKQEKFHNSYEKNHWKQSIGSQFSYFLIFLIEQANLIVTFEKKLSRIPLRIHEIKKNRAKLWRIWARNCLIFENCEKILDISMQNWFLMEFIVLFSRNIFFYYSFLSFWKFPLPKPSRLPCNGPLRSHTC